MNKTTPVDKIYLYAKDLSEPKYEFLINNRKNAGIKHFNNPAAFIEYSNGMDDVFTNIDHNNKQRKQKMLIIFDDMIADNMSSKNFKAIVKELFIRCRKLNISIVFITQSYFRTPKDARLSSTHYVLMKIGNKKELRSIAEEKSGNVDYKGFLKMHNYCTIEPYSFMTIDATPNSTMVFRKNFTELPYKNDQK